MTIQRRPERSSSAALPRTLSSHLVNVLRSQIITGTYTPGQPLREQDIEAEFGSSRGPVRESLRMLLQGGLVEYAERRGFRVRSYTVADVEHLYDLRASLEGLVIGSLAGRSLDRLLPDLHDSNLRMAACFETNDLDGYFVENQVFHDRIIKESGNRPISEVMVYVNEVSMPVRFRLLRETLLSRRSLDYHEQIVAHLMNAEIAAARRETEEHILCNKNAAARLYAV
ncbi:MAG: GntR family transcriptional regulator [Alphaproteobacteria bacterium]